MTNPQDNPGTPPPVFTSNTSSSTPPSETPKPRFRRQKMLARKTVASGVLRKVLNEKLKASHRKESPTQEYESSSKSEAFISASEGEEHRSYDTAKIQETPGEVSSCVVLYTVVENVENRFFLVGPIKEVKGDESSRSGGKKKEKERGGASGDERRNGKEKVLAICRGVEESGNKSGGSGSGEAAEGFVHLSKQQDELGSFVEETLADLLKRVGASYDPKKHKASTQKAPTASKPTKKSKMLSPKPTKALKESKKKKKEKGKAKAVESSEVAEEEEEEMELIHQERGTTVEVSTPKPKRAKASSKKSSSKPDHYKTNTNKAAKRNPVLDKKFKRRDAADNMSIFALMAKSDDDEDKEEDEMDNTKGKEVATEAQLKLESKLKKVKTSLVAEIEKNRQLQEDLKKG
ncbi:uncharacterized protein [Nicotiana sylvestris]|uniref:uncharacterized protein n=1 Tax=Nicotiana sylvestris TaxID=4096 RepID=UPI00388CAB40